MAHKYPNTGNLSPVSAKFRKSEKSPNATGYLDIGEDLIEYINQEHRAGRDVKVDLAAWTKDGQNGKWYSLVVRKPYNKEDVPSKPAKKPAAKDLPEDDEPPF